MEGCSIPKYPLLAESGRGPNEGRVATTKPKRLAIQAARLAGLVLDVALQFLPEK